MTAPTPPDTTTTAPPVTSRAAPSRRVRSMSRRITAAAVAVGLLGVAAVNWTPPASTPTPHQPARDIAAWTMPLDTVVGVPSDAEEFAEDLRLLPCLAEQGVDEVSPDADGAILIASDSWRDSTTVVPPLDRDRATRFGHGPLDDPGVAAWHAWRRAHNADVQLGRALDVCLPAVRTGVWGYPDTTQGIQSRARELRADARERALRDSGVVAAASAWRTCLTDSPDQDLAELGRAALADPMDLLEPREGDAGSGRAVSAAERTFALADVACQQTSGYRAALYDAQWDAESLVTEDDAALFSSDRADQIAKKTTAVRGTLLDG